MNNHLRSKPESKKMPPFFIFGAQRSGTTLFRLMINNHPALAIPPESHFFLRLFKYLPLKGELSPEEVKLAGNIIDSEPRFKTWNISEKRLKELLADLSSPTLADIVTAVFEEQIKGSGKVRWGDKTPEYIVIMQQISSLFPDAAFLCVVRDGRDVIRSLHDKNWQGWSNYQRAHYWADCVERIENFAKKLGEKRVLRVHYEDLVLNTEDTLRKVCSYLEVSYDGNMVRYHENFEHNITNQEKISGVHTKLGRKPRKDDAFRWKAQSSDLSTYLFELVAGDALDLVGLERKFPKKKTILRFIISNAYIGFGQFLSILYFFYHKFFSQGVKKKLNTYKFFALLKKVIRST
ncbi:MAG: sulfotransferase [Deltaproteobacteria bacterium]|nr:sulfotransferase [Deltaproteobacteria bacterium]